MLATRPSPRQHALLRTLAAGPRTTAQLGGAAVEPDLHVLARGGYVERAPDGRWRRTGRRPPADPATFGWRDLLVRGSYLSGPAIAAVAAGAALTAAAVVALAGASVAWLPALWTVLTAAVDVGVWRWDRRRADGA